MHVQLRPPAFVLVLLEISNTRVVRVHVSFKLRVAPGNLLEPIYVILNEDSPPARVYFSRPKL